MAIRNVAIPLLGSGALLLGYAAFSSLRKRPSAPESNGPSTQREAGFLEPVAAEAAAAEPEGAIDTGPLSERAPELSEFFELELEDVEVVDRELEIDDEPDTQVISSLDPPFHEPLGARFLARATDALSPFGAHIDTHFERERLDLDRFAAESSLRGAARAPKTDYPPAADEREAAAESERRPSLARTGVGS
ncbi:MAG TPA: hypothetical protein VNW92_13945 [Polyangiaceae bacterium]|nr:hypothetical protein [Polyangiaceae bacterium]